MQTASIKQLKDELKTLSPQELQELCLTMAKFKKENKELLTYLVFEAEDEEVFIKAVKQEADTFFNELNTTSYFFMKKGIRKILRNLKKYIRYSKKKETEAQLLLYFCQKMKAQQPPIRNNTVLWNMYTKQLELLGKAVDKLHEDLQFDFEEELQKLVN